LREFPGFGGKNSQTLDLAVTINNKFAKTDAEILYASGS